jgi:hypothetical protein
MRFFARTLCVAFASSLLLTTAAAESEDAGWTDRISFKGDFRLRYEGIDRELRERRERSRYRARLGLSAVVTSDVKVIMQVASGADNPVSRNVTFDGGFTTKDIGFDLVYVDWTAAAGLHVFAGKMKNPLFRAGGVPLIWDSDLNPEGFAATYSKGMFFGTVAGFSVEERSQSSDSHMYAAQAGARFALGENVTLTAGIGYVGYSNTVGSEPFYNGAPKGNTVDSEGNYVYDYKNAEVFAQFDTRVGDWPLKVYSHWTRNSEVDEQDTAIAYGAKIGAAKDKGTMEFSWTYQDIDADAVIGTFNDSDFGGGGTDAKGHIIKVKYAVAKNIFLGGTYFSNVINRFSLPEEDYDRFQIDLEFKFK